MNDDPDGLGKKPLPIEATRHGHFTWTLGLTGELDENYVSPRVALLRITNDLAGASKINMLYALERRGYVESMVIDVPDFQIGEDLVKKMLAERDMPSNDKWTCFLTTGPEIDVSPCLVFAFKSQVDRLLFSMDWPRD
jgi:hypothetical protein